MMDKYVLKGHEVVKADSLEEWAEMFNNAENRTVAKTEANGLLISTVFLGTDHSYGDGPPELFETMVFKPPSWSDLDMNRCSTWEEAEAMHKRMVDKYLTEPQQ